MICSLINAGFEIILCGTSRNLKFGLHDGTYGSISTTVVLFTGLLYKYFTNDMPLENPTKRSGS